MQPLPCSEGRAGTEPRASTLPAGLPELPGVGSLSLGKSQLYERQSPRVCQERDVDVPD